MNIASVSFFPHKRNVSGAHIASVAFKEWCHIFGIDCTLFGITYDSEHPDTNPINSKIDVVISPDEIEVLNDYDAIYFSSYPMLVQIDISKIKVPFLVMEHSEYERQTFEYHVIEDFNKHKLGYTLNLEDWHPCCLPKHLWESETIVNRETRMLYAARIFEMKNPILFIKAANNSMHLTQGARMIGQCFKGELLDTIYLNRGSVEVTPQVFSSNFFDSGYGLYWDVFGTSRKPVRYRRINLSCVEALANGIMPIVSIRSVPKEFKDCFIAIDPMYYSRRSLCHSIANYLLEKDSHWQNVNQCLENSHYNFKSVKEQMEVIIGRLGEMINERSK